MILLFLMSVRSTLITAISIPLSLLVAMIGLQVGGFSLNIFTLAALTVAVGRVVDDSIVVLENIKRRDTGHAALTPADIVASVKEVSGAVTASTATTVAVFLPVAVVSGVTGELFRPFAVTVAIALVASLIVSMTVVPVLAFWFLRGGKRKKAIAAATAAAGAGVVAAGDRAGGRCGILAPETTDFETTTGHTDDETKVTRLQKGYLPVLNFGLAHPVITLAMALVIFVGTLGASTLLKTDFLGSVSDDSSLTIKQELPAGTRLDTMSAAAEKVEAVLAADPDVKDYLTTIGGSIYAVAGTGANTAEITVNLNEGATADVVKPKLESQFAELGDTAGEITITQAANGSTSTDISVTVKGENSESLRKGAEQVQAALEGVPGLTNVTSNLAEQRKVLEVQVDHKKAADLGFTQAEIGQAVANALRGTKVGDVTLSGEQREVWVRTQDATDPSPADIGNLLLPVSQIQQAKAQDEASDKLEKRGDDLSDRQDALSDRQEEIGDEQQAKQDEATADSLDKLKDSQADAVDARADLRDDLSKARKSLTRPSATWTRSLTRSPKRPAIPALPPGVSPPPASQGQVAQLAYAQQMQAWPDTSWPGRPRGGSDEAGIKQLEAGIEQSDKAIDQLDEQIDQVQDQQSETVESRQTQEELTDEQKSIADGQKELAEDQQDLADLRAGAIRVKRRGRRQAGAGADHGDPDRRRPVGHHHRDPGHHRPRRPECHGDDDHRRYHRPAGRRQRRARWRGDRSAGGLRPARAGHAGGHRAGVPDHGRHVPQPDPAADPAGVDPVRGHRRDRRAADHRHPARGAGHGRPADADRHRGDQRHRADRPDQPVPGQGRGPQDRHRRRRPAASPADHHDRDGDDLRPDPDGSGADRRRRVHLAAAGHRGDRWSGLLDVLTLLLVPVLYSLVERRSEKKRLRALAGRRPRRHPAAARGLSMTADAYRGQAGEETRWRDLRF